MAVGTVHSLVVSVDLSLKRRVGAIYAQQLLPLSSPVYDVALPNLALLSLCNFDVTSQTVGKDVALFGRRVL